MNTQAIDWKRQHVGNRTYALFADRVQALNIVAKPGVYKGLDKQINSSRRSNGKN